MQMHAGVSQTTTDDTRAAAPGFFSAATTMVINTHTRWYQRVLCLSKVQISLPRRLPFLPSSVGSSCWWPKKFVSYLPNRRRQPLSCGTTRIRWPGVQGGDCDTLGRMCTIAVALPRSAVVARPLSHTPPRSSGCADARCACRHDVVEGS
jgi:hypothetical protein